MFGNVNQLNFVLAVSATVPALLIRATKEGIKMKSVFVSFAVVLFSVLGLTACGGDKTADAEKDAAPAVEAVASAADEAMPANPEAAVEEAAEVIEDAVENAEGMAETATDAVEETVAAAEQVVEEAVANVVAEAEKAAE